VKLRDLEDVTSIVVTHQIRDAFYIARHEARKSADRVELVESAEAAADRAEFMVLHDGRILFEGSGQELLTSKDPYLQEFLFMTLPPW
jgi:phospholipid/cholesterol/gamma-HCH transport system ATP-binding protein